MTHFEPNPDILQTYDREKEELLSRLTDDDLLLELRRRKRLARIQTERVIEGWRIDYGNFPPKEYILIEMMKQMAYDIGMRISVGEIKVPGMKIEEGRFEIPGKPRMDGDYTTPDLRYRIPFNFVVEKS